MNNMASVSYLIKVAHLPEEHEQLLMVLYFLVRIR